jgi:two-component system chemotaxis sensor kinase CheA
MLPFEVACQGLDAVVRDVARSDGKQARLLVAGPEVRIDRLVISSLREPLIHLVRNAVGHGVERPDARQRAGKPPQGTVVVSAQLHGTEVRVGVSDDGTGVDQERVRAAAAARGLPAEGELADLLFAPGLSTAEAVTLVSGRGVGLDVVRSRVEALGGSVTIATSPGEGTQVELVVPSSAATLRVLVASLSGGHLALPLTAARRVVAVTGHDLRAVENGVVLALPERAVPVVDLAAVLSDPTGSTRLSPMAVVVESGGEWAALLVDAILAEEEVVVRPPGIRLAGVPLVLGTAALPNGALITVLNPAACARQGRGRQPLAGVPVEAPPVGPRRVLLVEDSVTTRALERGILEGAGYEVFTAADGVAAWRLLQQQDVDLVVADVSMPNMDGLELCRRIRASARFSRLPVVLVTTLGSDEDRARGVDAGADAYITKASFDQAALLDTIARLL